jgi:deazaflavin-dependent oxidoreductase (nitroreductase family)
MILLWRLGLGSYGNGTRWGGFIMVIKHTGRRSGLEYLTPVNYAEVDGDIYCTAGFGLKTDWYRNLLANPEVEVWLPDGRWRGVAHDVSETSERAALLRRVIIGSGLAGPLFGVNPNKLTDGDLEALLEAYRLVRIRRDEALTGAGGPGDLAWVWPLATFLLLGIVLRGRKKRDRLTR